MSFKQRDSNVMFGIKVKKIGFDQEPFLFDSINAERD